MAREHSTAEAVQRLSRLLMNSGHTSDRILTEGLVLQKTINHPQRGRSCRIPCCGQLPRGFLSKERWPSASLQLIGITEAFNLIMNAIRHELCSSVWPTSIIAILQERYIPSSSIYIKPSAFIMHMFA